MSKPSKTDHTHDELFRNRLSKDLNPKHPLMLLNRLIDWESLEGLFGHIYVSKKGQPRKPIRLMLGLLMLQHTEGLSDEEVVKKWIENPYWQYFCGYDFLQWAFPIHPSSMTRWRKRLGPLELEKILSHTIQVTVLSGHTQEYDLSKVIADTTVMEKAVCHPTDSKLLNKARQKLVVLAKGHGIVLRQSYARVGEDAMRMAGRYAHARQMRRMQKKIKSLKTYLGRVVRDIERKTETAAASVREAFADMISMSRRLLAQKKDSKDKLYSLHAPETECISKGKARKRYEFGCKVSLVITHKSGVALASLAVHENPYDGHTLQTSLEKAAELSGSEVAKAFVDRGYKGHGVKDTAVYISGTRRLSRKLKTELRRRSAIEPHIGHMKAEGKLGRNALKGKLGDMVNAILCAVGHNLRLVLAFLMSFLAWTLTLILETSSPQRLPHHS